MNVILVTMDFTNIIHLLFTLIQILLQIKITIKLTVGELVIHKFNTATDAKIRTLVAAKSAKTDFLIQMEMVNANAISPDVMSVMTTTMERDVKLVKLAELNL